MLTFMFERINKILTIIQITAINSLVLDLVCGKELIFIKFLSFHTQENNRIAKLKGDSPGNHPIPIEICLFSWVWSINFPL